MNEQHDAWTVLTERGEWRGANEIATRALNQIHRSNNGQHDSIQTLESTARPVAARPTVERRRLPGVLVAAVAFVVVGAVVTIPLLVSGLGDGQVPETDAAGTSDTVAAPTTAGEVQSAVPVPVEPGVELVPMSEWPTPAVDPVLALPQCEGGDEVFNEAVDGWYSFLGRDPASASLQVVDLGRIAATTPVPRAGTSSLLTRDALEGSCTVAAVDGDLTAWVLLDSDRSVVMSAASVPMADNSVPNKVSTAPGEYNQWRIATGQTFTGPVDAEGTFHVVSSHRSKDGDRLAVNPRLLVGEFDPALVPPGYKYAGLLVSSLAMSILDAVYLPPQPDLNWYALPTGLPSGYGLCASTYVFILHDRTDGPEEERQQTILCDATGREINVTSPFPPNVPDGATETLINGHAAHEWSTNDTISIRLERPGTQNDLAFIIDASTIVGTATLRAIAGSTPIGSPAPDEPGAAIALVGVGDGIPSDVAELHVPRLDEGDEREMTTIDRVAAEAYIDSTEMSESMRTIQQVGLAAYETQPISYRFTRRSGDYDHESATFDVPDLEATVSIGQQYLPAGNRSGSPLGPVEATSGIWLISSDTQPGTRRENIQIIAYNPSIERSVNVVFGPRTRDNDGLASPIGVNLDTALIVVHDILDTIARPE